MTDNMAHEIIYVGVCNVSEDSFSKHVKFTTYRVNMSIATDIDDSCC